MSGFIAFIVGVPIIFISIIFLFVGSLLKINYSYRKISCTEKVKGIVVGYTYTDDKKEIGSSEFPIVEYSIDEIKYSIVGPKHQSITLNFSKGSKKYSKSEVNDMINKFYSVEAQFPLGSEVDVFYNLKKPSIAFVLKLFNINKTAYIFCGIGVGMFILAIIIVKLVLLI